MKKNDISDKILKYKNSIIKLQAVRSQFIEIMGQLVDYYDGGYIVLHKPIITADKSQFNFSSIMSAIIKLELSSDDVINNTLTVPVAPLYTNDGTSNIAIININDYIFVPLYEPKILKLDEEIINNNNDLMRQKEVSKIMADYIEYIYKEYENNITSNILDSTNLNSSN